MTWKISDKCFQHIDILKKTNPISFSIELIEGAVFEDLSQLLNIIIKPMANYVKQMVLSKYFSENITSMNHNSSKIPFSIFCCDRSPGKFSLSYYGKLGLCAEYITITHKGYKFRQQIYSGYIELEKMLETHFKDSSNVKNGLMLNNQQEIHFPVCNNDKLKDKEPFATQLSTISLQSKTILEDGELQVEEKLKPIAMLKNNLKMIIIDASNVACRLVCNFNFN